MRVRESLSALVLLLVFLPREGNTLRCFSSYDGNKGNSTCEGAQCFVSAYYKHQQQTLHQDYGCLATGLVRAFCNGDIVSDPATQDKSRYNCCSSENYCNRWLTVSLPVRSLTPSAGVTVLPSIDNRPGVSVLMVSLYVILGVSVMIILVLVLILVLELVYYRHKIKLKKNSVVEKSVVVRKESQQQLVKCIPVHENSTGMVAVGSVMV